MPKKKVESVRDTVQLERVPDEKPRKKKEKPKMTIEVVPVVITFD
jgi:hypothetical protein